MKLTLILEDNVIDLHEKVKLKNIVQAIRSSKLYNETTLGLQLFEGILEGISCDDVINEDEKLTEEEKEELAITFRELYSPVTSHSESTTLIELEGKTFCLSGKFSRASKSEVSKKLMEKGAIEKSGVSSKLDYLFVGESGSVAWKFGKIGGKIAKAMELQEKGNKIQIIGVDEM